MVLVLDPEGQCLERDSGLTCQAKGCGISVLSQDRRWALERKPQHRPHCGYPLCWGVASPLPCSQPLGLPVSSWRFLPSPSLLRNSSHNAGASRPGSPLLFPRNPFLRIYFNLCAWAGSKAPQFYSGLFLFFYKKNLEPGCPGALAPP